MNTRSNNLKCYVCGGRGHKEDECRPNRDSTGVVREAKPVFIVNVRGLDRVTMRGEGQYAVAMPPFGVEVTADALRINHVGDQIAFFGRPNREYSFELLLPDSTQSVSFRWGEYRVVVQDRFIIDEHSIRTVYDMPTVRPANVDFFIRCYGAATTSFGIEYYAREIVHRYRAFAVDRTVVVADLDVARRIRQWTQEEVRLSEQNRAEQAGRDMTELANDIIDAAVGAVADLNLVN